ncbi:DUF2971 domain-containing protein [Methanosarcina sp. Z-7115]|uniref:DUF2971 domain-containing protein n=1 Tax=Methanosarcina baikalica TaxID=3073890 RepID=A0ABU2D028_9EURY|nr:DUF2971 domain-containing protein [Methanosarcina sp. Z-7115]MDR7665324.1 DUF2971 domain-containing protein [Methanosarcina sp. Z-7115]
MNQMIAAGKLFYKYQPINKYLFENLKNNQLYFKNPCEFNDPFDSKMKGYYKGSEQKWNERFSHLIGNDIDFQECIRTDVLKLDETNGDLIFDEQLVKKYVNKLPLTYCLCEENNNILMWSHYADDHTGVCLSFKSKYKPKLPDYEYVLTLNSESAPIRKVVYNYTIPSPINLMDKSEFKQVYKFFLSKFQGWGYEKEYRIVLLEPNSQNINEFEKDELEGVIFGLDIDYKAADEVRRIIEENYLLKGFNVNFYKAEPISGEYKIRIVKIKNIDYYIRVIKYKELDKHLREWVPHYTTDIMR